MNGIHTTNSVVRYKYKRVLPSKHETIQVEQVRRNGICEAPYRTAAFPGDSGTGSGHIDLCRDPGVD